MAFTRGHLAARRLLWITPLVSLGAACGGSVSEPGWQPAELLARNGPAFQDSYYAQYPPDVRLAINANGEALATWERRTPAAILVSRYKPGSGWQEPTAIKPEEFGGVAEPDVAISASGAAALVWAQGPPYWSTFWSRDVGSGWTLPEKIQPEPSDTQPTRGRGDTHPALQPLVTLDDEGSATVLWNQSVLDWSVGYLGVLRSSLAVRRLSDGRWDEPRMLAERMGNKSVVGLPNGAVVAGWAGGGVYAARYERSQDWTTPRLLAPSPAGWPILASGRDGRVVAVWWAELLVAGEHWRARWTSAFGDDSDWSRPEVVIEDGSMPGVAIDPLGSTWLAWFAPDGLWVRSSTQTGSWSPRQQIGLPGGDTPSLAFDDRGNGLAVWRQGPQIWAARFDRQGAWQAPQRLQGSDDDDLDPFGSEPRVVMDRRGNALAVWSQLDLKSRGSRTGGEVTIWASRFERP